MARYRKKPVEVEVLPWGGTIIEATAVIDWVLDNNGTASYNDAQETPRLRIETLEGTMYASPGDYIIQGVNGEFYPCKPDIFEKTYEKVS